MIPETYKKLRRAVKAVEVLEHLRLKIYQKHRRAGEAVEVPEQP